MNFSYLIWTKLSTMRKQGGVDVSVGAIDQVDNLFVPTDYKNGMYQGEMAFRQKNGVGAFYWDSGEFYFGS